MRNSDADIAIDVLNKLIAQELEAASAGQRYGNRPLEECATIRSNAYTFARDKIREALADTVEERDARNPFQCQRDELVAQDRALRHLRQVVEAVRRVLASDHLDRTARMGGVAAATQDLEDHAQSTEKGIEMSEETLEPPLPPIDARTEAVAERLFGLKWALRKDSTEIIHEEWQTASEWIRDGYVRQAIEVLAAADQAQPASADGSDYEERMRVEYRELTARAGRLRDMLQRYADGTLDFEPTCPITLLSRQLDVMDAYAGLLRHRAKLEHVDLEEQDSATE